MKYIIKRVIVSFLCAAILVNMPVYNYAYENDFYNKTVDEFLAYVQNDLTYFGETFSLQDYYTLVDVYRLFANDLYYAKYYPFNINSIKQEVIGKENFLDYVIIAGDSYSGNLNRCFVKYYNYKNELYEGAGHSIIENSSLYKDAIHSDYPIVVISTSVNDVLRQTSPYTFKKNIEDLFDYARINNKLLIIHSNCNFFINGISANSSDLFPYRPKFYDEIIKLTAIKYENVVYVDCKDIATREYLSSDDIHYNEKFHFQLAEKIYNAIKGLVNG